MITDDQLRALRASGAPPAWTEDKATDPQVRYIQALVEERQVPESWLERIKLRTEEGLTKGVAGKIIAALKELPKKEVTTFAGGERDRSKNNPHIGDIPVGRYAVVRDGENADDIAFFRVAERKNQIGGKYKIILTVAGPNEHLITGPFAKIAVKQIVRAGIGESATLYGLKIGRCSICHTQITNRVSRALGIGPVCGGRVWEDWEERKNKVVRRLTELGLDPKENIEASKDPYKK